MTAVSGSVCTVERAAEPCEGVQAAAAHAQGATAEHVLTAASLLALAGGVGPTSVFRETPAGAVDGSNAAFTLANTPVSGTDQVYLNGLLLEPGGGNDYVLSGATVAFNTPPYAGDRVRVSYQY